MSTFDFHERARALGGAGGPGAVAFGVSSRGGHGWILLSAMLAMLVVGVDSAWAGGWANLTSAASPSGVYLGDTPTLGTIWVDQQENGNNRTQVQVYADTDRNLSSGASTGAILTGSASQAITPSAPKATATGTWYWGIRVQYTYGGGNYDAWQWSTGWVKMSFSGFPNNTTSVTLNYTVSALNAPTSQSATRDSVNPRSEIDLAWTRGVSGSTKDTIILRKQGTAITTDPTQGTSYSVGNTIDGATVVYKGNATSFADTGLSSDKRYYYKFYAENYNYYSAAASADASTQADQPTVSPNNLSFTSVGQTSMTINWGNVSTQVLVVVDATGDPSTPTDATTYTANSTFGSGSAIGSGRVVYKGSGTSVAVSGLSANTLYYVSIFNFNGGNGSEDYQVGNGFHLDGNRYTLATEPSGHVSGFTATAASQTQINLSWTAAAGPPTGYLILQRNGAAPTGAPADATGYSVGNSIGDGTVAAIVTPGSSTSVSITGLSAANTYHFKIFPYNGAAAQAYNYRTAATVPSANATTPPNPPSTPGSVTATDGTSTSHVTVDWADSIGEAGYTIWRNTVDNSGSASAIGAVGASILTYNDTSATPGQLYYYWVTATNSGGSSAFSNSDDGFRKLATVTGVAASDGTYSLYVEITWTDVTGETGYGIWRNTVDNSGSATYLASAAADATSYNDVTTIAGDTYYYWVRATNNTSLSQSDFSASDSGYRVILATYEWDAEGGADRDWSTAANWTGDTEPFAGTNAFINGGFTGVVSQAGEAAADLYVGNDGFGRLEQTGGALSVTNFYLGFNTGNKGTYAMSGGALTVAVDMAVGFGGVATAEVSGAASKVVIGGNLQVGFSNANNNASFMQSGGTVTVNRIYLGKNSATEGAYTITAGSLSVTDDIYLADGNGNSTGRMVIAGTASVTVGDEFFAGRNGQGILAVRDSATLTLSSGSGHLEISDLSGNNNNNLVQLGGGTINVGGDVKVGDAANSYGSLTVSNGLLTFGSDLLIANNATATGVMTVVGGNVDPADDVFVGALGNGTLFIQGGTITADQFYVANAAGSRGAVTMSGGALTINGTVMNIGVADIGTFTLSGGTITAGDGTGNTDVTLGSGSGGNGTFLHTAGTLAIVGPASSDDSDLVIGSTGSGKYTLAGGAVLDVSAGDDILVNANGILELVGSGWTVSVDDDFTMASGASLNLVVSNGLATVPVDDDITVAGTLNVSNVGAIAAGSYTVITSLNNSAVIGTFSSVNWQGGYTGTVSYANGAVVITFQPEIAVSGNGVDITDGDATPSTADHTDFGSALVAGGTVDRTFTVTNSGTIDLTIGTVTVGGTHAADFTVTVTPAASIQGGGAATTFTVQFNPSATGLREATISFANNDLDENPFNFSIQGYGAAPEIAVSGNGNNIADGDASPSLTDHTDFGSAAVAGGTVSRTYTVTNIGAAQLTLGSVSIGGTHSADFTVTQDLPGTLASSNSTVFIVEFDPSAAGVREATISFTNNDTDENPFNFSIQGYGTAPEIALSGNGNNIADGDATPSLTDHTDFGSAAVAGGTVSRTYTVTNAGNENLTLGTISIGGTHAADFSVDTDTTTPLASSNSLQFVIVFDPSDSGTREATISFTNNDADENPFNFSIQGTGVDVSDPSAATATVDGPEMVRLAWTKHASYNVMIVHRAGSASTAPSQGTGYNVGDAVGGGTVIYKGSGAALEHIVSQGTTHHYAFYSYDGSNFYSPGLTDSDTTGSYGVGELVDQFAYTNDVTLGGKGTGQGWTNNWTASAPKPGDITVDDVNFATFQDYWPSERANRLLLATTNSSTYEVVRNFAGITSGQIYVGVLYRRQFNEGADGKFSGVSLMQGTSEILFFGERGGAANDDVFGLNGGVEANYGASDSFPAGTDYLIIGKYDFGTDVFEGIYYTSGQSVPSTEPTFFVKVTNPAPTRIDGVRLFAGASSGWNGEVYFDELRVATNWTELLRIAVSYPAVTNFVVNDGSNVTDGQLAAGNVKFVFDLYDQTGIETVNTTPPYFKPNFDIFNNLGTQILTDEVFEGFAYINGGSTVIATDYVHSVAGPDNITLGAYTSRVSMINSNGFSTIDVTTNINGSPLTFTVVDDDTADPFKITITYGGLGSKYLVVATNTTANGAVGDRSGTFANTIYRLTDGYLANLAANSIYFAIGAEDVHSGISQGSSGTTNAVTTFAIGAILDGDDIKAGFNAGLSSTTGPATDTTNVWSFSDQTVFDDTTINALVSAGTSTVFATIIDSDNDRTGDRLGVYSDQVGYLAVLDDDTVAPAHSGFRGNTRILAGATFTNINLTSGLIVTGLVNDAGSGVYAGSSNTFVLTRNGAPVSSGSLTAGFSNGGNGSLSNTFAYGVIGTPGTYTLEVFSVDYDIDRSGDSLSTTSFFTFVVVDPPQAPGIGVTPAALTYHVMLGNAVSNNTFTVNNIGTGNLIYTNYQVYGAGASGWLTVLPASNTIGTLGSQLHTGSVSLASISVAGTYVATNTVAGNQTNAAQNVVATLIVTNIPDPTAQSATADGNELVRLAWTKQPDHDVMIIHATGSAPGTPAQNTVYNLGDAIPGGGSVIYKGSAAAMEHVVSASATHYYEFYSIHNSGYYSPGVSASVTMAAYAGGEIVDAFAYTNNVLLQGIGGGQGWTNTWSVSALQTADVTVDNVNFATFQAEWPSESANRVLLATTNTATYQAIRNFDGVTSGKIYVGALYRRQFDEGGTDGKFSGISLMQGSAEQLFFGERGGVGNDDVFGLNGGVAANYGASDSFAADTDYLIIGKYDFDTDIFEAIYYTSAQTVPSVEPTFFISVTNSAPTRIDGVRLLAGDSVSGWPGEVYFDEVRVASTWQELLRLGGGPYATNYNIGGNATNYVTDASVAAGQFPVVITLKSDSGVETTNSIPPFFLPNFDLYNASAVQILTDQVFASFSYLDATTVRASNSTHTAPGADGINLGTYSARWSAIASNSTFTVNASGLSNGTQITFTVFDDDSVMPTPVNMTSPESGASRSMHVTSNATAVVGSGSGTDITYTLRDGDLTSFSGASPLILYFGGVDTGSGLARGNDTATTNTSLTIGQGVVSNVFNWDSTRSSDTIDTDNAVATNVWSWIGSFLPQEIDNLVTNTIDGYGTNKVTVTWRDADSDRANDQTTLYDYQHGWIVVVDDDTTGPTIQNFNLYGSSGNYTVTVAQLQSGTGWSITGRVSDASGINVGSGTTQPDIEPYFQLLDPSGAIKLTQVFDTLSFADGGATTLSEIGSFANGTIAVVPTGTWTARVVVADNDEDRTSDRAVSTNEFAFEVVIGPSASGMMVAPSTLNVTSTFGIVAGDVNWPSIVVSNNGIGFLNYSASFSYSGGSGWLGLSPSSNVSVASGAIQTHTASIDTTGLNPGTYQATVSLVGDQTNGTQQFTVNLTVVGYFANEIVDQFDYTAAGTLDGKTGGSGWSGAWSASASNYTVDSSSLAIPNNYPASTGNKVCAASAAEPLANRSFTPFTTGTVYAAVAISKTDPANGGYAGLSLMNGSVEEAFAGKLFGIEWFGIDLGGSSSNSNFGIYGGSTYLIIIKHSFDTGTTYGEVYNPGDTVPLTEPGSWRVAIANPGVTQIDGIRLGGKDVGTLCFDELRVAGTYASLLNQFGGEPTLQATALTFANITTNSMTASWNNGNGGARIVVVREGSPVTFSPVDGSNYTANADFSLGADLGGGNKVVFNGSGNSVGLSALTSETNYFFAIYEYNGSGGSTDFLTNSPLTGSRWTLKNEPAEAVADFDAHTVGTDSISNSWTLSVTAPLPDGYLIFRRIGEAPTNAPVDGVGYTNNQLLGTSRILYVTNGTDVTFLHEDLLPCEEYHFAIYPFRYNPASVETYNYYTATPGTATAGTDCTAPTLQASNIVFSLVGTNTITLSWDNGNGDGRIVVVRGTNTVNAQPVDGTTYSANTTYGSGSHLGNGNYVVYAGTGSSVAVEGLVNGQTYSFHVFEYNGSGSGINYNTNTATLNPRNTQTAAFGLVEEKFGYGNWENLSGKTGGTGWTNSWSTGGGLIESSNGNFPRFGAYPEDNGTVSGFMDMGNFASIDGKRTLSRNFPGMTSGRIYMGIKVNDNHTMGLSDYLGVNLMNGGSSTGFFGKAFGVADQRISLEHNGASRTNRLDASNPGYQINAGVDYLLIAMYDFDTHEFKLAAYTTNNIQHADPDRELGWQVEMENVSIDRIDGIEFVASDNDQFVSLDHIRIGPSWEAVVWNLEENHHVELGPVPTLIYIGTNYGSQYYSQIITNLSDEELRSADNIDFAVRWESTTGVFITNNVAAMAITNIGSPNGRVNPNWDPLAVGVDSNRFNLDKFFTNYFGVSGDNVITTYNRAAFNITNIDFEVLYFVTVSAENQPGGTTIPAPNGAEQVPVNRAITINEPLRFYVYDDDTNVPVRGASGMVVMTNGVPAEFQSVGDDRRYFITDGALAAAGMDVSLNVYDDYSGLQRAAVDDGTTNLSITIDGLVTNDAARLNLARSTADSKSSAATNVWSFSATNFTFDTLTAMWGGDGSGVFGQDINVLALLPDADQDRVNDQAIASNEFFGIIRVTDDDSAPPFATNIGYGVGSTANNRPFYMATNGFSPSSTELIRGNYPRRSGTGTDTIFAITDEELANADARGLEFVFGVRDNGSGISRGASGSTNEVMSFSIGDVVSGIVDGFNAGLSSGSSGPGVPQTNVYTFADGYFDESVITNLIAITDSGTSSSVRITVPDSDNDRLADRSIIYDLHVGHLRVYDDDVRGPAIPAVNVLGAQGGQTILFTSFEDSEGWADQSSGTRWTNVVTSGSATGAWYGTGYRNFGSAFDGTDKGGFTVSGVGQYFEMPPRENVGVVSLLARLSSDGGARGLAIERWDGSNWISYGTNEIVSSSYEYYAWSIDFDGMATLRVVRVGTDGTPGIFIDSIQMANQTEWISTNQLNIGWAEAVDDYSGVGEYRYVAPAVGASPPSGTNGTVQLGSGVTSVVQSILGQQGVITGYLFAIDGDDDWTGDRSMGNINTIIARVDTNPPPVATNLRATDAANGIIFAGIDESSEIKIEWTPPGATEAQAAGWRQSDNAALSPWDSYIVTYAEVADENGAPLAGSVTTVLTTASTGWDAVLNSYAFTNLVLSNLNFDAYYEISIQGRDEAGNIGLVTSVIGNTDRFTVTQGVNRIGLDLQVYWKGVEGRDYDVLYVDSATGFRTSLSNQWQFMQYTNSPVMFDTGGVARVRPGELTDTTYRFYRVAKTDRWQTNRSPRVGSVEVYVTKALELYPGENWHSTFFIPDTATVAYVFNTNLLPAADNMAQATKISWFNPTAGGTTNQNGQPHTVIWLSDQGDADDSTGTWVSEVNQRGYAGSPNEWPVPQNEGFLIELPSTAEPQSLVLIGLVPTQAVEQVISGGTTATNNIHMLSYNLPARTYLKDIGIKGSGFTGNNNGSLSDEVRILAPGGQGSLENPKARIRLRTDQTTWQYYYPPTYPGAPGDPGLFIIEPDDTVVIIRRTAGTMIWTNSVPFEPPTKNFTP